MGEILARTPTVAVPGGVLPVADAADLILLKLYAGGSQDLWDIEQLLAAAQPGAALAEIVDARLAAAPAALRVLWERRAR